MAEPEGDHRAPGAPVPERLMMAATRLFAERGFERTSVQDLVGAAGVTKGAMYHYFSSKDDLLYAVYQRVLAKQMDRLAAYADSDAPLEERLHAAAADVVRTTIEHLDDALIFFRSLHMLSADRQAMVRKERRAYHERFRAMVEEGRRSGRLRSDIPADIVVNQYFGAVHHLGMWFHADGELSGDDVGRYYADLLLAALRPQPPGGPGAAPEGLPPLR